MTNITLTPIRASDTQDLSVISPNTQTLFAPKATVEKSDDYGVVSYTDIGNFVSNYSYSKEEIDDKDDEHLQEAKRYTDDEITEHNSDTNTEAHKGIQDTLKEHAELTAANTVNSHDRSRYAHETIRTSIEDTNRRISALDDYVKREDTNIRNDIQRVFDSQQKALVFESTAQIKNWISGTYTRPDRITTASTFVGQNIYSKIDSEPDYWVNKAPVTSFSDLSILPTDKITLEAKDVEFDPSVNNNILNNTNVQGAIDSLTDRIEDKTSVFELGTIVLRSENWRENASGLWEYPFTNTNLTSLTDQLIELTPSVNSSKLINDNDIVIYSQIKIIDENGTATAIITAETQPYFDIVCDARIISTSLALNESFRLYASQIFFNREDTDLNALTVQDALSELSTKATELESKTDELDNADTELSNRIDELEDTTATISTTLQSKVDKVIGKGLSTNDLTNSLVDKINNAIQKTEKGANNGVAPLNANGIIPAQYIPGSVDEILEYLSFSSFPETGESGKIYVALDTNLTYRWSGSAYVEISPSLALGETSSTAYAGDKGKQNADAISELRTDIDNIVDGITPIKNGVYTTDLDTLTATSIDCSVIMVTLSSESPTQSISLEANTDYIIFTNHGQCLFVSSDLRYGTWHIADES